MLIKVCDICGEKIDDKNYVVIESSRFYVGSRDYMLIEDCDICKKCADKYSLTETLQAARIKNV